MERETLIKQCRYYNGEEENTYGEGGDKAMFWFYERWWAEKMANGDTDVLSFVQDEFDEAIKGSNKTVQQNL